MHGPRIEKVNGHYKEITGAPTFGIKNLCRGAPVGQGQERETVERRYDLDVSPAPTESWELTGCGRYKTHVKSTSVQLPRKV